MIPLALVTRIHVCVVMHADADDSMSVRASHLTSDNTGLTQCKGFCFYGQTALPGFRVFPLQLKQQWYLLTCCNYVSHLSLCSESRALLCNINSLPAKQEVIFLLIGRIPAVCGSVLSAARPCGNTRVLESDRGRMQADHSSLCQFLVLRYQSISLGVCVCVCVGPCL